MKKLILLLLLIFPISLICKNVKKETILKVAEKVYMKDFPATQNVKFDNVIVVKNETDTLYYIVCYPKDGLLKQPNGTLKFTIPCKTLKKRKPN